MAKLSAHGETVGTIEYTIKTVRYMSDCKVLVNYGDGWKLRGKLKPGVIPVEAYQRAVQKQKDYLAANPCIAEYRKQLHDLACRSKRQKLHYAVTMMPEDCDGVWSECCDGYGDNISADIDEVSKLCRAYLAAMEEQKNKDATITA